MVLLSSAVARAQGFTRRLDLEHGAFDHAGAPDAIVHASARFDPRAPLRLVVFLHGYRGCAEVLAASGPARCHPGDPEQEGWGLLAGHDRAQSGALFIIAQLALRARDGSPGRLGADGGFARFLEEVLAGLEHELGGARTLDDVASISLLAHSAGFETALAVIARGGTDERLRDVVLLDALYGGGPRFLAWVRSAPGRRLLSIFTGSGTTALRNRDLARRARRELGARAATAGSIEDARDHVVTIAEVRTAHGRIAIVHLEEILGALDR